MTGLLAVATPSRRRTRAFVALAGLAGLLLAACGASAPQTAQTTPDELLSGEYNTLSGDTIDLGSLEGQDLVFWFWAPW